jgi:hypothetical protein
VSADLAAWLLERLSEDEHGWCAHSEDCSVYTWDARCDCGGQERWRAECDAKRRIVELHKPGGRTSVGDDTDPASWREYCETCGSGEPYEYPTWWPCDTLKLLALPYADREGYREEWKP